MRGKQKKIAVLNDLAGFGRCSLTVQLPVISALKVQCCPVPTAILSNHTGYEDYFFDDYTRHISEYTGKWKRLGLSFDGILTGFLGSAAQFEAVEQFLLDFGGNSLLIVDPVMGDNGKCYATYNEEMCSRMRSLTARADLITPNLTECCILTDTPYELAGMPGQVEKMAEKLLDRGTGHVTVTGVARGGEICNYVAGRNTEPVWIREKQLGAVRCGTGDIFSAVLSAELVAGKPLADSVKRAAQFVRRCLEVSEELEIPLQDGLAFEEVLDEL